MVNLSECSIELDLKIFKLGGRLADDDRQCAWELYSELSTRRAVVGSADDPTCSDFTGELLVESLDSLYAFFREARGIMKKHPVGRIKGSSQHHLGMVISRVLSQVLRPFLEKWHVEFRFWWQGQRNNLKLPLKRQFEFPNSKSMLKDWADVRKCMRELQDVLVKAYDLPVVHK